MAKDWEDGPDDEEEPPLTQRELLDASGCSWQVSELYRWRL